MPGPRPEGDKTPAGQPPVRIDCMNVATAILNSYRVRIGRFGRQGDGTAMPSSSIALSNLRGFVILIVVAFHSVLAYQGHSPAASAPFDDPPYLWLATPIIDSDRWFGFDLFCASQYVYLMHFMFFLSGLFVWPSLVRKGSRTFLWERTLRLGVPFVLGVYLLMPIAHYPVYRVTAVDPSWSAFWQHWTALPFWTSGPLWFLWFLLMLNLVVVLLYWLSPRTGEFLGQLSAVGAQHPGRYFAGLVAVSAVAYMPLAAVYTPWDWVQFGPFSFQRSFALHYAVFFFAGLGVGVVGLEKGLLSSTGMLTKRWARWAGAAVGCFLLWIIPTALIFQGVAFPGLKTLADFALVLSTAASCFALAAIFLRFGAKPWSVYDSLSANAYGIYLIHYVFVTWLQYLLLGIALFAVAKAAIVFTTTLSLSWAATAAIRRVPIGAQLLGAEHRAIPRTG
jgi:glucans biosynthesis protein C